MVKDVKDYHEDEIEAFRDAFDMFDLDGGGAIDCDELQTRGGNRRAAQTLRLDDTVLSQDPLIEPCWCPKLP